MKFAKIIIVTVIVCLFLTSCNTVGSGQTDFEPTILFPDGVDGKVRLIVQVGQILFSFHF